jgi:hypothetical protein
MKQIFLFVSLVVIGAGLYLMYFYDVPDSQLSINFFVSWFLVIVGCSSLLINLFWSTKPKDRNRQSE